MPTPTKLLDKTLASGSDPFDTAPFFLEGEQVSIFVSGAFPTGSRLVLSVSPSEDVWIPINPEGWTSPTVDAFLNPGGTSIQAKFTLYPPATGSVSCAAYVGAA